MLRCVGAALSHLINSAPLNPDHLMSANKQPTHLVAYKETREGIYGPYEVEVDPNYKKEVSWEDFRTVWWWKIPFLHKGKLARYRSTIFSRASRVGRYRYYSTWRVEIPLMPTAATSSSLLFPSPEAIQAIVKYLVGARWYTTFQYTAI